MTDQLSLEGDVRPAPGRVRVETLAKVIAGFAAPDHGDWTKVPKRVMDHALKVSERALREMEDVS